MNIRYIATICLSLAFVLLSVNQLIAGWNFMFSNKHYQNQINVNAFLVDKKMAYESLISGKLYQKTNKELPVSDLNIVLQLKNIGDLSSWGVVVVDINNRTSYKININGLPANMTDNLYYVVPISGLIFDKSDMDKLPIIKTSWEKLYAQ